MVSFFFRGKFAEIYLYTFSRLTKDHYFFDGSQSNNRAFEYLHQFHLR